jgi:hypothetical protein
MSFVVEHAPRSTSTIAFASRASAPAAVALPPATWQAFVDRSWEKWPDVMHKVTPGPLVDADVLLSALQAAARAHRAGQPDVPFVTWVDSRKQDTVDPLLPLDSDTSLVRYMERLHRELNGREFTLLLANPHLFDRRIKRTTSDFLDALLARTGIPCGGVDTGIFLGRYGQTPFGVHRGQMSVMTFPVVGTKRFLLWERGYGEANADIRDALQYDRHLPRAIEKIATAGDVLYWPADFWHIADGTVDYSAALNVGFWWDRPPLQRSVHALTEALAGELANDPDPTRAARAEDGVAVCLTTDGKRSRRSGDSVVLPRELEYMRATIRAAVAGPALDSILSTAWLAFASGCGFRDLPELAPLAESIDHSVTLAPVEGAVTLSSVLPDGQIAVAAEGHVITVPNVAAVAVPLVAFESGSDATCLIDQTPDPQERRALVRLAEFLVQAGAAYVVREQQS